MNGPSPLLQQLVVEPPSRRFYNPRPLPPSPLSLCAWACVKKRVWLGDERGGWGRAAKCYAIGCPLERGGPRVGPVLRDLNRGGGIRNGRLRSQKGKRVDGWDGITGGALRGGFEFGGFVTAQAARPVIPKKLTAFTMFVKLLCASLIDIQN